MRLKKLLPLLTILLLLVAGVNSFAANGNITYSGNSGHFIFSPGSAYSPTDLFPDLKDVMPGDSLHQKIQLENKAKREVKEIIYMRSLGADDDESAAFLSQLQMTVTVTRAKEKSREIFRAPASETADLTDWVCLGTLYYGGKAEIDVTLDVPTSLDTAFQKYVGKLTWEFRTEELPLGPDDPPITGDNSSVILWCVLALVSIAIIVFVIVLKRKNGKKSDKTLENVKGGA